MENGKDYKNEIKMYNPNYQKNQSHRFHNLKRTGEERIEAKIKIEVDPVQDLDQDPEIHLHLTLRTLAATKTPHPDLTTITINHQMERIQMQQQFSSLYQVYNDMIFA